MITGTCAGRLILARRTRLIKKRERGCAPVAIGVQRTGLNRARSRVSIRLPQSPADASHPRQRTPRRLPVQPMPIKLPNTQPRPPRSPRIPPSVQYLSESHRNQQVTLRPFANRHQRRIRTVIIARLQRLMHRPQRRPPLKLIQRIRMRAQSLREAELRTKIRPDPNPQRQTPPKPRTLPRIQQIRRRRIRRRYRKQDRNTRTKQRTTQPRQSRARRHQIQYPTNNAVDPRYRYPFSERGAPQGRRIIQRRPAHAEPPSSSSIGAPVLCVASGSRAACSR